MLKSSSRIWRNSYSILVIRTKSLPKMNYTNKCRRHTFKNANSPKTKRIGFSKMNRALKKGSKGHQNKYSLNLLQTLYKLSFVCLLLDNQEQDAFYSQIKYKNASILLIASAGMNFKNNLAISTSCKRIPCSY